MHIYVYVNFILISCKYYKYCPLRKLYTRRTIYTHTREHIYIYIHTYIDEREDWLLEKNRNEQILMAGGEWYFETTVSFFLQFVATIAFKERNIGRI